MNEIIKQSVIDASINILHAPVKAHMHAEGRHFVKLIYKNTQTRN